jgi:1,4-alpha-glucan branching enzyme
VGVPEAGFWKEMLNSDAKVYGGSGSGNFGGLEASPVASHGKYYSLSLNVPPLGVIFLKREMKLQAEQIRGVRRYAGFSV